jgi:hypothetical protein
MFWPFKKRKITFYSKIPHGDLIFPIVESKSVERSWKKKCVDAFKKHADESPLYKHVSGGHRCPGIMSLVNAGFIVKCHRDIYFETNGDGIAITSTQPNEDLNLGEDISFMNSDVFATHIKLPMGAVKSIAKIATPWFVEAPKDIQFLVLPVPYNEDNRFTVAPGILDPVLSSEINIMLWWFIQNGKELLRKDTPLAQLIPISKNNPVPSWEMSYKPHAFHSKTVALTYMSKCTRVTNYKKYKEVANQLKEVD